VNDDLSLRPGMTATADINVAEADNVFTVSNAALRYEPSSASTAPGGQGQAQKKTFVQTLMPGPPRRSRGSPGGNSEEPSGPKSKAGNYRVWTLKDGKPEAVAVKLGITDGRVTEVSGEGLSEGLPIILRANPVAMP